MNEVVQAAAERGVPVGTFVDTAEGAKKWAAAGVRYIACSVDVGFLYDALRSFVQACRPVE
jgi:2-keto-3-deoxy-L-rhamnonate aldolase RhmA